MLIWCNFRQSERLAGYGTRERSATLKSLKRRVLTIMSDQTSGHQGILSLTIKDKAVLYSAYMPFVKNGGLFVPTNKSYEIGDEVFMLLTLMEEPEKIPIAGKVVWVTPRGAQGNRTSGIGVQFSEQDAAANAKIEENLAGMLSSDRPTHTM